jgi:hypothetical protein
MMFGAYQLVQGQAAPNVVVTIDNCPANTLWELRPIGAFNTWTQSFVELVHDIASKEGVI